MRRIVTLVAVLGLVACGAETTAPVATEANIVGVSAVANATLPAAVTVQVRNDGGAGTFKAVVYWRTSPLSPFQSATEACRSGDIAIGRGATGSVVVPACGSHVIGWVALYSAWGNGNARQTDCVRVGDAPACPLNIRPAQ